MTVLTQRALRAALWPALMLGSAVSCGGGGDGGGTGPAPQPSVAASITAASATTLTGTAGQPVTERPSVVVRNQNNAVMAGVSVVFAVQSGGGSVTDATVSTNASGVATVGGWTLGPTAGSNTLTATAGALAPVTFTANAAAVGSGPSLTNIAPGLLTPGITATITGSGFSATPGANTVTIAGTTAVVTAATATELTIAVPTNLPCEPTHDVSVAVTVGGATGARDHPLRVATVRTVAVGEMLVLGNASDVRCNELPNSGGRYLVNVYNTNRTYSPTPLDFQIRGAVASGAAAGSSAAANITPVAPVPVTRSASPMPPAAPSAAELNAERLHHRLLEESRRLLTRRGAGAVRRTAANTIPAPPRHVAVGDPMTVSIPDIDASICETGITISARVAYVGSKSIILEDLANPVKDIDSTYASIGAEFDNLMFGILQTNFGNPLASPPWMPPGEKITMVFSTVLSRWEGLAGFVAPSDFFPAAPGGGAPFHCPASNFGHYFYASVPGVAGTFSTPNTPPRWRWLMRSTVIHEAKHITSFAERLSRNASVFEESWLEESTARLSEELYERARYNFAQRSNIGFGSASNPVGPFCGVVASCILANDQPRGFVRTFEELARDFYPAPETHSPIGRLNPDDFSFYSTGWSLVRWALDHASGAESAFLSALTQSTTHSGLNNLEARAGRTFAAMLPEWMLAMALDDRAGFAPASPRLQQPSWNLRNIFAGLRQLFPSSFPSDFPLVTWTATFGNFVVNANAVSGAGTFLELSGTQAAPQLIEVRSGPGVAPPDALRVAIVRVQ